MLTEQFVATLALERFVRELPAADTNDFFNHLSLELILDLVHFDVEGGYWLRTHEVLHHVLRKDE